MDDLEYSDFSEYPCRICGSVEYRYYGGGYNCREGHRNDELREQVGDEEDFDFNRSQMRLSMSQSRMTPQTARVATKKFRKKSGKGDHDVNSRYGITEEQQSQLFEEERSRFQRQGDKKKHVIMEAAMQVLILQIESVKNKFPFLWAGSDDEKKKDFESLARKLFQAYSNVLSFQYSHTDSLHPELPVLAPAYKPSPYFLPKKQSINTEEAIRQLANASFDDLDKELMLDDYDYGNESSLSDSDFDFDADSIEGVNSAVKSGNSASTDTRELGRLLELSSNTTSHTDDTTKATRFPAKRTKPLCNPFSYLNMTFLTHLALIHSGVPVLFSDLARGLEMGKIPGYRPDFQLSKDIVTVRFNINEIRAFHTRFLPGTDQLYYDSRLMMEMLAKECRVPDWKLDDSSALLLRLMDEMALPRGYFPYIKCHVDKCIGSLNFVVISVDDMYLTPCALLSAAILFFLRLVYTLTVFDEEENWEAFEINDRLKAQGLATQDDLVEEWQKKIQKTALYSETRFVDEPVKDEKDFDDLLEMANRILGPTRVIDNTASIKGLFGAGKYDQTVHRGSGRDVRNTRSTQSSRSAHNAHNTQAHSTRTQSTTISLPCDNFKRYRSYSGNLESIPSPHALALKLIQKLVGIQPRHLERVISEIFEKQDSTLLERERVVKYARRRRMRMGMKDKVRVESEVYTFY